MIDRVLIAKVSFGAVLDDLDGVVGAFDDAGGGSGIRR